MITKPTACKALFRFAQLEQSSNNFVQLSTKTTGNSNSKEATHNNSAEPEKQMELGQSSKIIYTKHQDRPNLAQSKSPVLNGKLTVLKPAEGHFAERVRIGVGLKTLAKPRSFEEWSNIINKKNPLSTATRNFQVDKDYWFSKGVNWVIPTPIFEKTKIHILLEPSALLSTGFLIEIFRRDSLIIHEVSPSPTLSAGATIELQVNWQLTTVGSTATPVVRPARWIRPSRNWSQSPNIPTSPPPSDASESTEGEYLYRQPESRLKATLMSTNPRVTTRSE